MIEKCFYKICFSPLDINGPKFFGFSEFLAGLALMILAWTIADVRYRFRVQVAPLPLKMITFSVVVFIGLSTILTDLWRASGWLVLSQTFITSALWQTFLAITFFITFLIWIWFAFIRPPVFGKLNSKRYLSIIYRYIIEGVPTNLAIIADELTHSVPKIIKYAPEKQRFQKSDNVRKQQKINITRVEIYAHNLLDLIADKRFCKVVVESSPITALAFFEEISDQNKYSVNIPIFARNIVNEAISNKESFIYHEAEWYDSGLIGEKKPITQAIFSNFDMVETIGTMFDTPFLKWDADQWAAYSRVVLITTEKLLEKKYINHKYVVNRAISNLENSVSDLYVLNGVSNLWENDTYQRLRVVIKFIKDFLILLEKKRSNENIKLRSLDKNEIYNNGNIYDILVNMLFEIICKASFIKTSSSEYWTIHHNTIWREFFGFHRFDSYIGRVFKFKLRRVIYNEILKMNEFPNFQGAAILGFCLNIFGLEINKKTTSHRDVEALHKVLLTWTKKNFAAMYNYNPKIAEQCLIDGLSYEPDNLRIVKTYPIEGLRQKRIYFYLEVDPPQPNTFVL
ncbi:hypothetical protein OW684_01390 [Acinetobacter baumannii]|uniref:hypothetical protein n=1 Tax=Acinetobacter baumannii TaxID=470 RepID=UPI0023419E0B|nr:hypothetical protein [Acinetobacter baumannii]MDC5074220.1 hypothetical protein [Acinetobacter baumannii]MDK2105065.1 hypothetical protein [Acinetobacter baumannii]MDK2110401.1 hypothetical protein [Acinetobacter baumannii]MDK2139911.1 hypothetical protein [Acinetobacter baumannii]MDK2150781.1 hypothetical protein [Acinetobacter baumannii]